MMAANVKDGDDSKDCLIWEEEQVKFLLECMLEQSRIPGMKAGGSLKPSAMKMVDKKMCEQFGPQFNRDKIRNKLKKLKANLVICKALLAKSGFSFDNVHKCLVVDADIWAEHLKYDPKHSGFKSSKHWKHYEVLSEIFDDSAVIGQISGTCEHSQGSQDEARDCLVWEEAQVKFLLECMLEQSHIPGMKAGGILKPCAMKTVNDRMCEKFGPQFNKEKIRNKLKKLKANFVICKALLSKNGFSFDNVHRSLTVDANAWTEHIKYNPKHKGFKSSKHWKHYELLSEIFNEFAATGQVSGTYEHSEGFQDEAGSSQMPTSQFPPVDVELDDVTPVGALPPSRIGPPSRGPTRTSSKRRKSTDNEIIAQGLERFITAINNFTNSKINIRKECSQLLRMYCDSGVLSEDEVNDALEIFESENLAKCFITYPEENRIIWLHRKLHAAHQ